MRSLTVILGCLTVATTCPAQTPNWTETKPSPSPSHRFSLAMAYDSARQRTVLFGGGTGQPGTNPLADTWELDGRNWTRIQPINPPSAREGHAMSYDSARQRTVLFGGLGGVSSSLLRDTWEWDGSNWTQIKPTNSPPARWRFAMAYDSARQRTVLFGGLGGPYHGDTWEWDGKNWTQVSSGPPARGEHQMAYDSSRKRTVLFGGRGNSLWLGDTWEWDGNNWTQVKPTASPAARRGHAMTYDSSRQRTVLFGGSVSYTSYARETWEWDGRNWSQIKPANSPESRWINPSLVFDSVRQRVVLFGGETMVAVPTTWEYGIRTPHLAASTPTISLANGGTQTLRLNAGTGLGRKLYWIFGSETGTSPGVNLLGVHIPLNPDLYTLIALVAVNGKEFTKFRGALDANGLVTASLNVPANLPFPPGFKLYHAYVVYDGTTGKIFSSSNAVSVEFK